MRVLQVSATYSGGGPGSTAKYVHEALKIAGVDSVVTQAICKEQQNDIIRIYTTFDLFCRKVLRHFHMSSLLFADICTHRLICAIKREHPDIVHIRIIHHGIYNYRILFKFLEEYNRPVVFTLHDMWLLTGGCYHYLSINCDKYRADCSDCSQKRSNMDCFQWMTKKNLADKKRLLSRLKDFHLIAVSEWVKSELSGTYLEAYPCTVIRNAVDTNVFKPYPQNRAALTKRKYAVIGVANMWSDQKGLSDFFQLATLLGNDYEIVLVGSLPPDVPEKQENMTLLGKISSHENLAQLYSDADIFVHLSYQETFGMVIAEAACCGKRVIGYDISAIPEVVHAAQGTVVSPGDIQAVTNEVRNICQSASVLDGNKLAEVRASFSSNRMTDAHISLYRALYQKNILEGGK